MSEIYCAGGEIDFLKASSPIFTSSRVILPEKSDHEALLLGSTSIFTLVPPPMPTHDLSPESRKSARGNQ